MRVMFNRQVDTVEAAQVSEGIGEGIKEGHNKRKLAIAALNNQEREELYAAENTMRLAERAADELLVLGAKRQGIDWIQKRRKLNQNR